MHQRHLRSYFHRFTQFAYFENELKMDDRGPV
jgi:hypothetical protein